MVLDSHLRFIHKPTFISPNISLPALQHYYTKSYHHHPVNLFHLLQHFQPSTPFKHKLLLNILNPILSLLPSFDNATISTFPIDIKTTIKSLPSRSCPNSDGILFSLIKKFPQTFSQIISRLLCSLSNNKHPPTTFFHFLLFLLPKPDLSTPDNFRPISIPSTLYKLATKHITSTLNPILTTALHSAQFAFL